jgi:hypothetical protein
VLKHLYYAEIELEVTEMKRQGLAELGLSVCSELALIVCSIIKLYNKEMFHDGRE